jgi:hypothetical protein
MKIYPKSFFLPKWSFVKSIPDRWPAETVAPVDVPVGQGDRMSL